MAFLPPRLSAPAANLGPGDAGDNLSGKLGFSFINAPVMWDVTSTDFQFCKNIARTRPRCARSERMSGCPGGI